MSRTVHDLMMGVAVTLLLTMVLSGCGGGGSGGGSGGEVPRPATYERENPMAEDLLDHWNQPEALRASLGLSVVDAADVAGRRHALADLINAAGSDAADTGTKLGNARPEEVEIIGERDGITYGRWIGGPAGTLNIEFDWQFASSLNAAARARIERAGKAWSRRLRDDFGPNTVPRGTVIERYPRLPDGERVTVTHELNDNVQVDDVLIAVVYPDTYYGSSSGGEHKVEATSNHLEPWFGSILLAQPHVNRSDVIVHEIGHVIGIRASKTRLPSVSRYIDTQNHTFEGPESQRVNGGRPIPFQWVNERVQDVPPGTPGARVDYDHFGACNSIMAYCRNRGEVLGPTELDYAFLADIGYEVLDARTASEPEVYGYGAWGRYSAWGAGVERILDSPGGQRDTLRAGADAFGIPPSGNLSDVLQTVQGGVTWTGALLGVDLGRPMLPPVFGDVELRVELSSLQGNAVFDDLMVHVDGVSSAFRAPRLEYDIGVTGNLFSDESGYVRGGFYGAAHEEIAGVLDDRTISVNLLAGFGGMRDDP